MCYITESSIDHDNDCLAKNNKECERCHDDCSELLTIEYCTAQESAAAEMEDRECKAIEQNVCPSCKRQLASDAGVVVV